MRRLLLGLIALFLAGAVLATVFWSADPQRAAESEPSGTVTRPITEPADLDQPLIERERLPATPASTATVPSETAESSTGASASADTVTPSPAASATTMAIAFWLSREELAALPALPETIREWAERDVQVRLGDQNNQADAVAVAAAYACANTGEQRYCDRARALVREAAQTDVLGMKTLALNRNLAGYIVVASLLGDQDPEFAAWLQKAIHTQTWTAWTDDWSIYRSAMQEPSNGGCHARATVTAVALYTGDAVLLDEMANRFHDWLGRSAAGWLWDRNESWWQSAHEPDEFRGVNPPGARLRIDGVWRNVDGVLPEDMKRSGRPAYPFPVEGYVRECQQGMVATAWMLQRAGYPAFEWEEQAVLRSFRWFAEEAGGAYRGDDAGLPYLIRSIYGADYVVEPARPGKNGLGFYDWTHSGGANSAD